MLDLHRDIAAFQYDVALAFSPFLPQNACFLLEPRRVGLPTRHGTLPTRRGAPLLHQKTTRATRVVLPILLSQLKCPI